MLPGSAFRLWYLRTPECWPSLSVCYTSQVELAANHGREKANTARYPLLLPPPQYCMDGIVLRTY
jgi:hypothetical protein